ncbi:MAG: hypothetical protein K5838_01830 [Elusimicrobiales bacterium]|nr:hypothetical protein [Elusimicrobiales bacterium]
MFLTKDHFKHLLKQALEHIYEGNDDSIYGAIGADGDMKHDIVVVFFYEKERIIFNANSPDMSLEGKHTADILFFVNKWNTEYLNQCCFYDENLNKIIMTGALFTDVSISDEYVLENFIHFHISTAIRFFTEAEKFLSGTGKE